MLQYSCNNSNATLFLSSNNYNKISIDKIRDNNMRNIYTNEITEDFDNFNPRANHYMCYGQEDITNKELPIIIPGKQVGSVVLNNSNKIFAVYVDTNLTERYTDEFEKYVSDKFMDKEYKFNEDIISKT